MFPDGNRSWYYLGCRHGPGHRLFDKQGRSTHIDELLKFDGQLCPKETTLYQALLTRLPDINYSALAWWDQAVDHRPGSNSIIFAPSSTCTLDGIRAGMSKWFSWVEKRLPTPLIVLNGEVTFNVEKDSSTQSMVRQSR